jgi:5-formyltetrahydrofolate cyclo-ligase
MSDTPDTAGEKAELRRHLRVLRAAVGDERRRAAERKVCDELFAEMAALDPDKGSVGLYAAMASELSLDRLAVRLCEQGYRLAYPAVLSDAKMAFYTSAHATFDELAQTPLFLKPAQALSSSELKSLILVEPQELAALVVPALAYDARGYRLGQGGGYYDRYLRKLDERVAVWGVGFAVQMLDLLPVERHDVPLERVIVA